MPLAVSAGTFQLDIESDLVKFKKLIRLRNGVGGSGGCGVMRESCKLCDLG